MRPMSVNADGSYRSIEIPYIVSGVKDVSDGEHYALEEVRNSAPAAMHGLYLDYLEITARENNEIFRVSAYYSASGTNSNSGENEEEFSFNCGGGTRHVNTAIRQTCIWKKDGASVRDPGTFIGWNGKSGADMVISGADIPFAQPTETYSRQMSFKEISTHFRRQIASLVGKVNSAKWKGWERGEVMFLGCSLSGRKSEKVTVNFNFSIAMNETQTLFDTVKVKKEGHIYVWPMSEIRMVNGEPKVEVTALFAAQITGYADFSVLGV